MLVRFALYLKYLNVALDVCLFFFFVVPLFVINVSSELYSIVNSGKEALS